MIEKHVIVHHLGKLHAVQGNHEKGQSTLGGLLHYSHMLGGEQQKAFGHMRYVVNVRDLIGVDQRGVIDNRLIRVDQPEDIVVITHCFSFLLEGLLIHLRFDSNICQEHGTIRVDECPQSQAPIGVSPAPFLVGAVAAIDTQLAVTGRTHGLVGVTAFGGFILIDGFLDVLDTALDVEDSKFFLRERQVGKCAILFVYSEEGSVSLPCFAIAANLFNVAERVILDERAVCEFSKRMR